jgi:hypothetical protein
MVLLEAIKEELIKKYPTFDYEIIGSISYFLLNGLKIDFSCVAFDTMSVPPEGTVYYYHKPST